MAFLTTLQGDTISIESHGNMESFVKSLLEEEFQNRILFEVRLKTGEIKRMSIETIERHDITDKFFTFNAIVKQSISPLGDSTDSKDKVTGFIVF